MTLSIFFARFLGIALVVICIGLLINRDFYREAMRHIARQPLIIIFAGLLDIFLGLFIILLHNIWALNWIVLITLLGWFFFIRGSARVLFPNQLLNAAAKMEPKFDTLVSIFGGLFLILGLFLTLMGFKG